jgi:putative peptide maturation system protein
MELLWEEEACDYSVHYDTLLHLTGQGTVSLSFCPEKTLPWPLRGVHRWSERDLVRVNTTVVKVDQAIAFLDFIWNEAPILKRLIHACLIQEALDQEPIPLANEELQRAMDTFRQMRGLHKAEDTRRWMEQRGLTHEKLERQVGHEAKVAKLRDRVTAGRVEEYFETHRADFDTASLARFEAADKESAQQAWEQIRTGELHFYEAAERCFQTAEPAERRSGDLFTVIQRGQEPSELGNAVFAASRGAVLGPFRTGERYTLVRVLSLKPACLDEPTQTAIKQILFEKWLEERRQAARIEWYWGNAARLPPAVATPTA